MIQISNLTKKYGETVVFANLNYTFENTCIYGLVGRMNEIQARAREIINREIIYT